MLLLKNEEIADLVSVRDLIGPMEAAFKEFGAQRAQEQPRFRIHLPIARPHYSYCFNNLAGAVPGISSMALRIDSFLDRERLVDGRRVKEYPGDFVGLVLLFDLQTCDLLAMMDDHALSTMRVAATSAVAARYLARADARVLGLFGTGRQARAQIEAMAAVRPLREVRVYSPTREHREAFAAEMTERLGIDVRAVSDPKEVVEGADIVNAATNSGLPVFSGQWLKPGMHVTALVGGDWYHRRDELDEEAYLRADRIVINTWRQLEQDRQGNLWGLVEAGKLGREQIAELGSLLDQGRLGRESDQEITLYKNNHGMGIQFAVAARVAYEKARAAGRGRELPDEWFKTFKHGGLWAP